MWALTNASGTGDDLNATQIGQQVQGAGDGKVKMVAGGGFGRVVGGNTVDLRIAFNGIDNFR